VPQGAWLSRRGTGVRPGPERNGAQASCLNVTGTARRMALSGAARRRVCMAERPCGSAEAGRGFRHDGRRLESFLHLLARGDGSS